MPLYDFECNSCGFVEESLQSATQGSLVCPRCGGTMKRLPSYPAMVKIKGMGGYPSRRKMVGGTAPYQGGR